MKSILLDFTCLLLLIYIPLQSMGQSSNSKHRVWVQGGTFYKGLTKEMAQRWNEKEPRRFKADNILPPEKIKMQGYYLEDHEVTNAEYCQFLNSLQSSLATEYICIDCKEVCKKASKIRKIKNKYEPIEGYENHPVVCVSWYAAKAYCNWVGGRLPTINELEYAQKEGAFQSEFFFSGSDDIDMVAVYGVRRPSKVKSKKPNRLGIFDLTGNVSEWSSTKVGKDNYTGSTKMKIVKGAVRILSSSFKTVQKFQLIVNITTGFNLPERPSQNLGFRVAYSR